MPGIRVADEANATKRPSLLIDGVLLAPTPGTGVVLLSVEITSVLGWIANNTEPLAAWPVLSVTVSVAVKLPAVVGVPLTTPVIESMVRLVGNAPPNRVQVKGGVPPVVESVEA